jgi:arylsulfatase A-like enzyme
MGLLLPALMGAALLWLPPAAAAKPNLLYVLADDYGRNDVGYHGSEIATPTLDRLAHAGVKLESFYTQPICAATRASVMTGRYVHRLGFQHFNPPVGGGGVGALPLVEKLLPQYLKAAGFVTHHVGKWHLGATKVAYMPQNRGFDSSFGYYSGQMDYYDHSAQGFLDLHRADAAGAAQRCQPSYNGTYSRGPLSH